MSWRRVAGAPTTARHCEPDLDSRTLAREVKSVARAETRSLAEQIGDDLATERNLAMLAAVVKRNTHKKRAPMKRAAVDRLRMQQTRGDKKTTVPLPPSVRALLTYDAGLVLTWWPVFHLHEDALKERGGILTSTTMKKVYSQSQLAKAYRDLKKSAEADMPALIELGLGSDQRVFLYVAEEAKTKDGEYPILRFDDEPCTWITAACLQDEILSFASPKGIVGVPGAEARKKKAETAVAKWLKREPEQRFVEEDDDD
jgi:hypothetical protein